MLLIETLFCGLCVYAHSPNQERSTSVDEGVKQNQIHAHTEHTHSTHQTDTLTPILRGLRKNTTN